MSDRIVIDFESRSCADLRKVGAFVYAADSTTSITHVGYQVNREPPRVWRPGHSRIPNRLADALADPAVTLVAHNVQFERAMGLGPPGRAIGLPKAALTPLARWDDTAARCAQLCLPRDLERALKALHRPFRKDMAGHKTMLQLSKPRTRNPIVWWGDPAKVDIVTAYCRDDVIAEADLDQYLPPLTEFERATWEATERLNEIGVAIDPVLLDRLIDLADEARHALDAELDALTGSTVPRVTLLERMIAWLAGHGVEVDSLAKDIVAELVERDDVAPKVRRALEIRQEGGGSSATKVAAMRRYLSADGRIRGALIYGGASSTVRWSSHGPQLQNMARHDDRYRPAAILHDLDADATLEELEWIHGPGLKLVSELTRPTLIAPSGMQIVAGDYAQVESRILCWLAGQKDKLDAFRRYDVKAGPDLYKVTAGRILGIRPDEVSREQRQFIGKVTELACGFGGGGKALRKMAKALGTPMDAATADKVKHGWRDAHGAIVEFWRALEGVICEAIRRPGDVFHVGALTIARTKQRVIMRLPSGRRIYYWEPSLKEVVTPWGTTRWQPHYWAQDAVTRQWSECAGYGGLFAENATQSVARDLLADALVQLDRAGHRIVLLVHDEIVVETAESPDEIGAMMRTTPTWASGLPVAVDLHAGPRYLKQ